MQGLSNDQPITSAASMGEPGVLHLGVAFVQVLFRRDFQHLAFASGLGLAESVGVDAPDAKPVLRLGAVGEQEGEFDALVGVFAGEEALHRERGLGLFVLGVLGHACAILSILSAPPAAESRRA